METSLRLSPRGRVALTSVFQIGFAHFVSRRFDEAVPKLLLAIQEDQNYLPAYRALAACYSHMGRLDDARKIIGRLRTIAPFVIPHSQWITLRNPEHRELYLSGLRSAAGEAT
jgi:hypothetical protein